MLLFYIIYLPTELSKIFTHKKSLYILESEDFLSNITSYNNALSFTSLGANIDKSVAGQKGVNTFRISGQLTHNIGTLLPKSGEVPTYAQIFLVGDGGEEEANIRLSHFKNKLQHSLLLRLQTILSKYNPYVQLFRSAGTILKDQPNSTIVLRSLPPGRREKKTYNKPGPQDVGAIIQCDGEMDSSSRHVVIQNITDGSLQPISDLNTFYFGVRYPCLLWFGSHLWDDQYISPSQRTNPKRQSRTQ